MTDIGSEPTLFQVRYYDSLDSTNEEAKRLLNAGGLEMPTIIRAGLQTAGKGTQGRQWHSPAGAGLYMSIAHPFVEKSDVVPLMPTFTLAAGLACAEALRDLLNLEIRLKPINDLYLNGCKLGGILVESLISGGRCRALITGIGLNVADHLEIAHACEQEGRGNRPTSLQAALPPAIFAQWHLETLLSEISIRLADGVHAEYHQLFSGREAEIRKRYMAFKLDGFELPN